MPPLQPVRLTTQLSQKKQKQLKLDLQPELELDCLTSSLSWSWSWSFFTIFIWIFIVVFSLWSKGVRGWCSITEELGLCDGVLQRKSEASCDDGDKQGAPRPHSTVVTTHT